MNHFNLGTLLTRRAQHHPDKPALVFEGRAFSFHEFNERSNQWANAFSDLGLKTGERVGMLLTNRNEFLEAFFGLAKIGAVLVPLNWRLAPPELEYICKDSGINHLIFGIEFSQTVETIRSRLDVDDYIGVGPRAPHWAKDVEFIGGHAHSEPKLARGGNNPAVILYTSGTTGHPRGVVRDHLSFLWLAMGLIATLDFRLEGRVLMVVPLYYGWGLNFVINAVHTGYTTVLMKAFDALRVLETIREDKVDTFLAVPKMLQEIERVPNFEKYLSSLRTLETSESVPAHFTEKYLRLGVVIRHGYGLTEAGYVTVATSSDAVRKPDSEGLPLSCTEVRVVDEKSTDLPLGGVGEILIKGPTLMTKYWANPEATQNAIRDGWLHTGDLGRLDEDGYVYVVGRIKDLIRSGAENVSPREVENVLKQHPKILEVAVIGQPDPAWGEKVCALVRPREDESLTVEEIVAFCQGKIASFKIPKEIILTNKPLPHNPSGKLVREVLRERLTTHGIGTS